MYTSVSKIHNLAMRSTKKRFHMTPWHPIPLYTPMCGIHKITRKSTVCRMHGVLSLRYGLEDLPPHSTCYPQNPAHPNKTDTSLAHTWHIHDTYHRASAALSTKRVPAAMHLQPSHQCISHIHDTYWKITFHCSNMATLTELHKIWVFKIIGFAAWFHRILRAQTKRRLDEAGRLTPPLLPSVPYLAHTE